jgi:hypothetical protein
MVTERIAFPRIGNLSATGCVLLIIGVTRIGAPRKSASSASDIAAELLGSYLLGLPTSFWLLQNKRSKLSRLSTQVMDLDRVSIDSMVLVPAQMPGPYFLFRQKYTAKM